ncbi:MAG: 2TM domain-containing protein, partial [Gemmatimonadota bacterium]|nr:2TM domain-containing protein [Gemmatimonadota bacterium]
GPAPSPPRAPADPLNAFGVFRAGASRAEVDVEVHALREQQRAWRDQFRAARGDVRQGALALANQQLQDALAPRPVSDEDRVWRVRRKAVNYLATTAVLFGLNIIINDRAPWFLIPAFFMGVGLVRSVAGLWADGIPLRKLFARAPRPAPGAAGRVPYGAPGVGVPAIAAGGSDPLLAGVPRDVMEGRHGRTIRDASEARLTILDVLEKLPPSEKQLLPDIGPTVKGLVERIVSLASALHQLEQDASPDALARLDQRLVDARALAADAPDKERRVGLLERQRQTLADLAARRDGVAAQLDNASLVLGTMKLDLLKLRSSGLQSQMADSNFQTQDARVVVSEIQRALEVAEEVQKLR